ncbi:MAG: SLC13 family permease [Bacillota bacterium]|nr:SLC13 family permease [Bacillota bacterium]
MQGHGFIVPQNNIKKERYSMNMAVVMLIAIAAAILLGFATGVNTGLIAMAFSYIIGSFVLGIKPTAIQVFWPVKIFFVLFAVSFFYNYSTQNGTLEKLAHFVLYKFGKSAKAFPFVLFVVAWLMSAAGAGAYSIIALLCPISFIICDNINMSKVLAGMAVYYGAVAGGVWPTSSTGATQVSIIAASGFEAQATTYGIYNCLAVTGYFLISLIILYFVLKGHKVSGTNVDVEKPAPFTPQQKKSLGLIITFVVILLVPYLLGLFLPSDGLLGLLQKYNDVAFTAIILSIAATLLNVGDEKKALLAVPWNTIVMICGIGIIVSVAVEAGTIGMIVSAVSNVESPFLVPLIMSIGAGIMSIFSSTTGVVLPTLYPTVGAIANATGVLPVLLLIGIIMGAVSTGMSPFSACGGIMMGCVDESYAKKMYNSLLIIPFASLVLCAILVAILVPFFS